MSNIRHNCIRLPHDGAFTGDEREAARDWIEDGEGGMQDIQVEAEIEQVRTAGGTLDEREAEVEHVSTAGGTLDEKKGFIRLVRSLR